jgi:hypothetical protein
MTSERGRIDFLIRRDGMTAALEWVRRTVWIYRNALKSGSGYGQAYRRELVSSCCDFRQWLRQQHAGTPLAAGLVAAFPTRQSGGNAPR